MRYDSSKMLGAAEELELVAKAQAGDQRATQRLVDAHVPLIVSIASHYSRYGPNHDDLLQEAKLGMVVGIGKFEAEKGWRLSTYARWWIRAMVLDWMIENKSMVRMGTTAVQKKLFNQLKLAKQKLGILNDHLTREDLARLATHLGESAEDIESMNTRLAGNAVISLDYRVGADNEGAALLDTLADPSADPSGAEDRIDEQRRMSAIAKAMEGLEDRARDVIRSRFLIDETLTLEDLSHRYGVTRERIRQIEAKALDDLRGMLPNKLSRRLGIGAPLVL